MEQISEEEPPGKSPFLSARAIGKVLHLDSLFFKFEGMNVTGTQKDRISKMHVMNAISNGYDTISVATCGNYGASISYFARNAGINSVVLMPRDYSHSRGSEILSYGAKIMGMPGKYEDSVQFLHDNADANAWYDASPGARNSLLDLAGYTAISEEIVSQLGHAPEYVAVPVGNGTTLAGIHLGFRRMYTKGLIDRMPRLIASSTADGNPIVTSWKRRRKYVMTLDPLNLTESPVNEPLISYRSFDGQIALDSIYESRGFAVSVTDAEMVRFSRMIERYENLSVLPASSSAMVAAARILERRGKNSECVVVLTGRGGIWTTQ